MPAVPAAPLHTAVSWRGACLLVVAACGKVANPVTDAPLVDAEPVDAAIDAAPVTDRNCAEVKVHLGNVGDGVYTIDPDGTGTRFKPFQVYCVGLTSASPKEYLELRRITPPATTPSANYATFVTSADHGALMCDCGTLAMVFTKVRIDPATLVVDPEDRTFAVFTDAAQSACWQSKPGCHSGTGVIIPSYAIARSCVTGGTDSSGRANVDLRDMPFHVAGNDSAMFVGIGFEPLGNVTVDSARKQVNLTGGGDCGGFGVSPGLALAQDF